MVGKTCLFTILTGVHEADPHRLHGGAHRHHQGARRPPGRARRTLRAAQGHPRHRRVPGLPGHLEGGARATRSSSASLRVVDAFAHVLRLFEDETVPHEKGSVDPAARSRGRRDRADPQRSRGGREAHGAPRQGPQEDQRARNSTTSSRCSNSARPRSRTTSRCVRSSSMPSDEKRIRGFQFLSQKPMLYVLNLGEEDAAKLHEIAKRSIARARSAAARAPGSSPSAARSKPNSPSCRRRGARTFWPATASRSPGWSAHHPGDLRSAGPDELPHRRGDRGAAPGPSRSNSTAVKAAGAIHTDFEKKFIRAEVVNWKALVDHNGYSGAARQGPAAAGRQRVHRQGRRRARHPPRLRAQVDEHRAAERRACRIAPRPQGAVRRRTSASLSEGRLGGNGRSLPP